MATKKAPAKKNAGYTVTANVPGVFESDDGKTVLFHEGQTVNSDDPCVGRALELYPDHFAKT